MANNSRDDFPKRIQTDVSIRAGLCCSNPKCRVLTKGPADRPAAIVSIGVASHIRAAAPGGPRFDPEQSSVERSAIENAIWLCANCARIVDAEPSAYPVELLLHWKEEHERKFRESIGRLPGSPSIMPELPVTDRYLEERGITAKLQEAGFRLAIVSRHDANTKIGLGEADYVVDPQNRFHPNNDTEAISGTFRASTQVEKRGRTAPIREHTDAWCRSGQSVKPSSGLGA